MSDSTQTCGEQKPPRVRPEHGSIRSNSVELDTKRVKEIEMNKGKGLKTWNTHTHLRQNWALHEHLMHQHSTNTERVSLVICSISGSPKNLSEASPSIKKIQCDGRVPLMPVKKLYLQECVVKLASAVTHLTSTRRWRFIKRKAHVIRFKRSTLIQIHTADSPPAPASLRSADRHRNTSASNWDVLRKLTISV